MARTTPDSVNVRERLITGSLGLIGDEGADNLSVRRLAEASGRSTMCVYTHFGGRDQLLLAAHERGTAQVLDRLDGGTDAAADLAGWMVDQPARARWMLTVTGHAGLVRARRDLVQELVSRIAGPSGTTGDRDTALQRLATLVGLLVLDENPTR